MYIINEINVLKPLILDKTLKVQFDVPKKLERFFNEKCFFAEYDIKLDNIPESILVLPLLSNILPIAWFNGVDVVIDEIDESFYNSIPILQKAFKDMYPRVNVGGNIVAKKKIKNAINNSGKTAQLFSGGLDSLATYIRRFNEHPYLVTVWGADVKLNEYEAWEKVKKYNGHIGNELESMAIFIKSNFRDILNYEELAKEFSVFINGYGWWPGIQHSLGLAGLCAPLTYEKEILTFYIPGSYTIDFEHPWGSDPSIDNNIKWANTTVVHESYDLSRQQKMGLISKFIREKKETLQIRVCWQSGLDGGNCNKCEKCCRTIVGLLLEGIDPNEHGFKVNESIFPHIRNSIVNNFWIFTEDEVFMWEDIQKHIPQKKHLVEAKYTHLFSWIETYHFEKFRISVFYRFGKKVARILPNNSKEIIKRIVRLKY